MSLSKLSEPLVLQMRGGAGDELAAGQNVVLKAVAEPTDTESLVAELRRLMAKRPVVFIFRKKDGTMRFAIGTTSPRHIPHKTSEQLSRLMECLEKTERAWGDIGGVEEPRAAQVMAPFLKDLKEAREKLVQARIEDIDRPRSLEHVVYFDLEKMEWRMFLKSSLVFVLFPDEQ